MSVRLSPLFNDEQLDNNGLPLAGGLVYWYLAGSTTPAATYADSTGSTTQANPVVLNVRGEPSNPIWLTVGTVYKAVLTDSLGNTIRTIDNISGINDVSAPTISEWVLYAGAASYINSTTFSVTGDATATFTVNRRIKAPVSGYTVYGTIASATYATGVTTVVITLDSSGLNSGLTSVYYGFLDPTYPSINVIIPAGTKMPFYQASPPVGWTATSIQNDSMMRVVNSAGSGGSSGAGAGHSPVLNNVVPSHTHSYSGTTSGESANHTHVQHNVSNAISYQDTASGSIPSQYGSASYSTDGSLGYVITEPNSVGHTHTYSGTSDGGSSSTNWSPRYMDFCIGTKS